MNMNILIIAFLSRVLLVRGIECYSCEQSSFTGKPLQDGDCYNVDSASKSSSVISASYCITIFSFTDGIVSAIKRDLSDGIKPDNYCETSIHPLDETGVEKSTCYYYCDESHNCNNRRVSSIKKCSSDCGSMFGQGHCDYLSGTCNCGQGFTGIDCSVTPTSEYPPTRKCVQCTTEVDDDNHDCTSQITGSECYGGEKYCFTTHSLLFTSDGAVRSSIIRGCSRNFYAVDECKFSDAPRGVGLIGRNYHEVTCYSTCDSDNCNVNIPDGQINYDETELLRCWKCYSNEGDCPLTSTSTSICPPEATHCKTTVTYVISKDNDGSAKASSFKSYKILSVVRGCSSVSVKAKCVETILDGTPFKRVTCMETCQGDGCNTGWPARPKCIQCTGKTTDERDTCINNPPQATSCEFPYQKYCYVADDGIGQIYKYMGTISGYPRDLVRGCSYYSRGSKCSKKFIRDRWIRSCRYTCTTDGCNVGSQGFLPVEAFSLMLGTILTTIFFHL